MVVGRRGSVAAATVGGGGGCWSDMREATGQREGDGGLAAGVEFGIWIWN